MRTGKHRAAVVALLQLAPASALLAGGAAGCQSILGIDDVSRWDGGKGDSGLAPGRAGPNDGSADDASDAGDDGAVEESSLPDTGDPVDTGVIVDATGGDAPEGQADAEAGPACSVGTTRCAGAIPQTCSSTGVWTSGAVTAGSCGATCTPGSTPACNGIVPQSCSSSGVLTTGTVTSGKCGAVCTPGAFQCGISEIGQLCGTLGTWISNGSSDLCACYVQGRFTAVSPNLALDSTTGLKWDRTMRAADTWTQASATCNNAGLRLPTRDEWGAVALLSSSAAVGTCNMNPAPFDQAAMPTSSSELGCSSGLCDVWTGELERGFLGYVFVYQFFAPSGPGSWSSGYSDDPTSGVNHPFRCVQ